LSESNGNDGKKAVGRALIALALFCLLAVGLFSADQGNRYLWVKALHIISVISWMAGMLYLPRLFIYHLDHEAGSAASETFKIMERRLFVAIMTPAMILSWVFGLWLAIEVFAFQGTWLHLKLTAVVVLTACHFYMGYAVKQFGKDIRVGTSRFWRLLNEVPTILMIVIVVLVILKPFG
jgi:protoporphyrinogen IX oxidase